MKRTICILLLCASLCALAAGCAQNTPPSTQTVSRTAADTTAAGSATAQTPVPGESTKAGTDAPTPTPSGTPTGAPTVTPPPTPTPTPSATEEELPTVTADPATCAHRASPGGTYCLLCHTVFKKEEQRYKNMIYFACDSKILTDAYKIAIADVTGNVKDYKAGALEKSAKCIMAGAGYGTPWTRDTAINVWNAFALLDRGVSKNTLLSVIRKQGEGYIIDGQYWDAVIWAEGAYRYILATGDSDFVPVALSAVTNSLRKYEAEEFDPQDGLFRGPAVYGDGIAAYPDKYAVSTSSGIEDWPHAAENRDQVVKKGVGIPMKALSTNCVYYEAYRVQAELRRMAGEDPGDAPAKADALKEAINRAFWNEEKGTYDYLAYECDRQEALGIAFALLFGVADARQSALTLENAAITEQGIACVWPAYERYTALGGYGRHSGTIWPHAQGFFARAASRGGDREDFENELFLMAEKAVRDGQFYEIYHPDTGEVYGGLQGDGHGGIRLWSSCAHQTWSATAYLSLIYYEILGAQIGNGEVTFRPCLPTGVNEITVTDLKIGNATFDIVVARNGRGEREIAADTTEAAHYRFFLSVD